MYEELKVQCILYTNSLTRVNNYNYPSIYTKLINTIKLSKAFFWCYRLQYEQELIRQETARLIMEHQRLSQEVQNLEEQAEKLRKVRKSIVKITFVFGM